MGGRRCNEVDREENKGVSKVGRREGWRGIERRKGNYEDGWLKKRRVRKKKGIKRVKIH